MDDLHDLRDIPEPDRDRRYPEDLRTIQRALDALALYGDLWGLLSLRRRPTLGEAGGYQRLLEKVESLRPEIERLGLYAPQRR